MSRAIWLVLDSLGLGAAPDAAQVGDEGADTVGHVAQASARASRGPLQLPNFSCLGLPQAHALAQGRAAAGFEHSAAPEGAWGCARERSPGKDTPSGHWESMGVTMQAPFGLFTRREDSFPQALLDALVAEGGLPGVLGNCHASGTQILQRLGDEHLRSGCPIVYTSGDSVFQIAAHEERFGLERLYALCALARRLLEPWNIGRVIARPFIGPPGGPFTRTGNRHDYSLPPPGPTLLDHAREAGRDVIAIGKIDDIFAHRGVGRAIPAHGNMALFDATLAALARAPDGSLVATNFVDFDTEFGHRRDALGYGAALEAFDRRLPELFDALCPDDLVVFSADHGCDPSWAGSDHTRELIPVLAWGAAVPAGCIGIRDGFGDIGATLAAHLGIRATGNGRTFLAG